MDELAALSVGQRQTFLTQMAAEPLDILVVGGGITGAGIALDAAARGYRVGLIERGDFASGTSSWSTKLVHGGIRYLPQFDIPLVREALIERGRLLANAPYLVHPLAFVLPLYASSRHPVGLPVAPPAGIGLSFILDAGLTAYDVLAGRENVATHRHISRDDVMLRAPGLLPDGLKTGFIYYDAQTNDTRLTLAVLRSAVAHGALVANYCGAVRFLREGDHFTGVVAQDHQPGLPPGQEYVLRARHIVNATGVWAEQVERMSGAAPTLHIAPSKGTHLVMSREALDLGDEAVVLPETDDGRIIFIVPWLSRALVGTTDTEVKEIDQPIATDDDVTFLLEHLNRYNRRHLTRDDILSTYAGNRPLLRPAGGASSAKLSRTHAIVETGKGLLTISGGKLTTYRRMAQDVLDRIDADEGHAGRNPTRDLKLIGATGLAEARTELLEHGAALGLDTEVIEHLMGSYGSEALGVLALVQADATLGQRFVPDLPYIRAEAVRAARAEMTLTLQDFLARRTRLSLEDGTRGVAAAVDAAALLGGEMGWSAAEQARQVAAYSAYATTQAGPLADVLQARLDVAAAQPERVG